MNSCFLPFSMKLLSYFCNELIFGCLIQQIHRASDYIHEGACRKEQWRSSSSHTPQEIISFAVIVEILVSSLYSGLGSWNRIFLVRGKPRFSLFILSLLQVLNTWHRAEKHPPLIRYSEEIQVTIVRDVFLVPCISSLQHKL